MVLAAAFAGYNYQHPAFVGDELDHMAVILLFRDRIQGLSTPLLDYNSTLGPVYFFAYATWSLASTHVMWLRLLSFLCFIGGFLMLMRWLKVGRSDVAAYALGYCSGAWALKSAFTAYSEQLTQFLMVAGIVCLTSGALPSVRTWLGRRVTGVLLLSLAVLTRAYVIFVFPLALLHFLLRREAVARNVVLLCCAALPPLLVWSSWHGLTPPSLRLPAPSGIGARGFRFDSLWMIPMALAHAGVYLSPWIGCVLKRLGRIPWWLLFLYAVLGLCLALHPGRESIGPMQTACELVSNAISSWGIAASPRGITIIFLFVGYAALFTGVDLIFRLGCYRDVRAQLALGALALYPTSLAFSGGALYERYFLPMNIFVLTLGWLITTGARRSVFPFLPFAAVQIAHVYFSI